jgi:Electron transfer flavoprotein domain
LGVLPLANILVYIESSHGIIIPSSLKALEEGRSLASRLGATLYAILSIKEVTDSNQDFFYQISAYGADKLIVASSPIINGPPRITTDGMVLSEITKKYPPSIFLFGDSPAATELAVYVSANINAIFTREFSYSIEENSFNLTIYNDFSGQQLVLDEEDIEQPVVVIVSGDPSFISGSIQDLEVIAFKNNYSKFQRDYYTDTVNYNFSEDVLLVVGKNAKPYINNIVKLSLEKEWSLLSSNDFHNSFPEDRISVFNSRGIKSGKTKIILFGLSEKELMGISNFISYNDKYLLVDCETVVPSSIIHFVIWDGPPNEIIKALEECLH